MPKKFLSYNDLLDIVSAKTGYHVETVNNILQKTIDVALSELQNVGKFKLKGVGDLSVEVRGGKDELMLMDDGVWAKKYIERKKFVNFEPNKEFINRLNGDTIIGLTRRDYENAVARANRDSLTENEKSQPYTYEDYVAEFKEENDETYNMLLKMGAQRRNFSNYMLSRYYGDEYKPVDTYKVNNKYKNSKKIKNRLTGEVFDSIKDMGKACAIDINKLYYAVGHGKTFVIDMNGDAVPFELIDIFK
jgi:nucleoid DNA-binding protein